MRITAAITGDLRGIMKAELKAVGAAIRSSVTESTDAVKQDWRGDVRSAGLGNRLANTIRSKVYPNDSPLRTAGFVWTKAPEIIDAHERGVTIRSHGGKYLAIPTDAAPKKGTDGKRVTPKTMPASYGELRFVPRRGKPPLLVADNVRVTGAGRVKGGTQVSTSKGRVRVRQSRSGVAAVMFILVPQVKLKKKFDLKAISEKGVNGMYQKLSSRLGAG
ncbi:MAG: hypothetical protein Dbin4_02931 [Alphaproteobacteria bacterium]|nr:hypothetical protein [Alphaproteobacteria bacterium]